MFLLQYQIPERVSKALKDVEVELFDVEYHEIYGPIELQFNDKKYGVLAELSLELPMIDEPLCFWFEYLNETALKILESDSYVGLKLPEVSYSWFEFINQGKSILIRKIEAVSGSTPSFMISQPFPEYSSQWEKHEVISKQQFIGEIVEKTNKFLNDIGNINVRLMDAKIFKPLVEIHRKVVQSAKSKDVNYGNNG